MRPDPKVIQTFPRYARLLHAEAIIYPKRAGRVMQED